MIKVNNVVKTFDGFRALDGLTMEVEKGSIYGLVGPNGAGKSTILRHITGIYRPDSGTITVDGAPVYENPAVKSRVAFIPDDLYYFLSASTRDMMKFYRGLYPAFDDKRYQVLKEAFPAVDEKQPIRRLSKGMQKQSAFWLAWRNTSPPCWSASAAAWPRAAGRSAPPPGWRPTRTCPTPRAWSATCSTPSNTSPACWAWTPPR